MLKELDSDDWRQAFGYAGEPDTEATGHNGPKVERIICAEDADVSCALFTREDVEHLVSISEGENDERPWLAIGQLKDERWFYLEAGCDYTGWDCQAGGSAVVAGNMKRLIKFGITPHNRERLNLLGDYSDAR